MADPRHRKRLPVHATAGLEASHPQSGGPAALPDPVGMGGFSTLMRTIHIKGPAVASLSAAGAVSFARLAVTW